mgnify:FL=1
MAFNRLRDIRDRMESKWTSGQFIFGYEDDVNENHNIDYPLLLVIPPTSTLPATEKDPINAHIKEEYEFEVIFAKPYRTSSSNTGANDTNTNLDVIYTLLEAEAQYWLQSFLDSYPKKEVTLVPSPITVERETNQHNDKVVQIRMNFTVDCFSHAFASFDDQFIRNLAPTIWLRSDIGVKTQYFGGKEVVTKWTDQSGKGNHFTQTTSSQQPEYKYEMADTTNTNNRYPFLSFDGTDDFLSCEQASLGETVGLSANHTIFYIAKTNALAENGGAVFGVNQESTTLQRMKIHVTETATNNNKWTYIANEASSSGTDTATLTESETANAALIKCRAVRLNGTQLTYFLNGENHLESTFASYAPPTNYTSANAAVMGVDNAGTPLYLNGSVQELMVFTSALSNAQIIDVMNYLNHKYNIY